MNRRGGVLILWGLLLTPAFGQTPSLEQRVVKHVFPNGITLLVLERHFSPTVSVRMCFRTGAVDEPSGKTGLAHMFEHMMFKGTQTLGTQNYSAEKPILERIEQLYAALVAEKAKGAKADAARVSRLLEQIRAEEERQRPLVIDNELWNLYERQGAFGLNAGTSPDYTIYTVDLPSNKLLFWAIVDSDRLKNPVFRQFYQEREVVKEERRLRYEANPEGKLWEAFQATAFLAHPYKNAIIGWMSDIDHLTPEDMRRFYRALYTPDRLTIAVAGDVKTSEVIPLVEQYFGSWRPGRREESFLPTITEEPPQEGERQAHVEAEAEPKLLLGYHVPTYPHTDAFALEAVEALLAHGQTSRLYEALVQKKRLASSIDAEASSPAERYPALFVIRATPRHPHTAAEVLQAIDEQLKRLKQDPIEPWEMEKIRTAEEANLLHLLQSNSGMAHTLAYCESVLGNWRASLEYLKALQKMTAADIQRVARTYFTLQNRTVGILVKKAGGKK